MDSLHQVNYKKGSAKLAGREPSALFSNPATLTPVFLHLSAGARLMPTAVTLRQRSACWARRASSPFLIFFICNTAPNCQVNFVTVVPNIGFYLPFFSCCCFGLITNHNSNYIVAQYVWSALADLILLFTISIRCFLLVRILFLFLD